MIKIIDFYYQDNSKFPDTIVLYTKHAGVIVYRANSKNPETCTILFYGLIYSLTGSLEG